MASQASPVTDAAPNPAAVRDAGGSLQVVAAPWPQSDDDAFRARWDTLAARAAEPNPFLESWCLLPALRALDPRSRAALLRFEDQRELAGVMPLVRSRRYYRWPFPHLATWSHANAFLGAPLVAAGRERAFWQALLAWADRHAGLGLFLHLTDLPLDGPLHGALTAVLADQRRLHGVVLRSERAMLASNETPEAYFAASLSGKKRKELRRQFARLSELGTPTFVREHGAEGLDAWTDQFLALEAGGWKGAAGSALASQPETAALFRETLAGAAARGKLERLALRLDGQPLAMLATFLTPPGAFSYKTAFDESHARFSPGVQLQCENLLMLDHAEIAWSDSCAAAGHPMIDHIWRERRAVGHLSIAIGGRLRRALFGRILAAELGRGARRAAT
ncbi:MAG TPA: GNAT family N-acetyltransferase [Novosphingobium sp.]